MNKKKHSEYKKHLETEAGKFRLTPEDLSNLTDLGLMIPAWFIKCVLKPNKIDKWFWKFFDKIERITLSELNSRDKK